MKNSTVKHSVLALSGGLDSTVLLYYLLSNGDKISAVYFDYGSKHYSQEVLKAKLHTEKFQIPLKIISLNFIKELFRSSLIEGSGQIPHQSYDKNSMSQTVVPGRNGIFLSILAGLAESIGANRICLANHAGDHYIYPDCRPEWIHAASLQCYLGSEGKVFLESPFASWSKGQICELGEKLGVSFEDTYSCYVGADDHCGKCGTCHERKEAFKEAKISDPTKYNNLL